MTQDSQVITYDDVEQNNHEREVVNVIVEKPQQVHLIFCNLVK